MYATTLNDARFDAPLSSFRTLVSTIRSLNTTHTSGWILSTYDFTAVIPKPACFGSSAAFASNMSTSIGMSKRCPGWL